MDSVRNALLAFLVLALSSCGSATYDLAIRGGRVMDPETGLDAVRNVGIQGNEIAAITEDEIQSNSPRCASPEKWLYLLRTGTELGSKGS